MASTGAVKAAQNKAYREKHKEQAKLALIQWHEDNPYRKEYLAHKHNAAKRSVPFHLSFEEWLEIWGDKIHERGPLGHQYCMGRHGDEGAYEVGNVKIITGSDNLRERHAM